MSISTREPWPDRFPYPANPNGWFRVSYSDQLADGEVKGVKFFGKELVLFRTETGEAALLDAHCPHMGANLGEGACVKGDTIRCPVHYWTFVRDGNLRDIRYAKRIPRNVKIPSWPIEEVNGIIMAHYHADGKAPTYRIPEVPQLSEEGWADPVLHHWVLRSRWMDMNENCVDLGHFPAVHGTLNVPTSTLTIDGHLFGTDSIFKQNSPNGPVEGHLTTREFGPGFQTVKLSGILDTLLINTATPIDDSFVDVIFAYRVKTEGDPRKEKLGVKMIADLISQFETDIPIWEAKLYLEKPRLCDGDGPLTDFRKWANQFY